MPTTIHKVLIHGAETKGSALLPINQMPENAENVVLGTLRSTEQILLESVSTRIFCQKRCSYFFGENEESSSYCPVDSTGHKLNGTFYSYITLILSKIPFHKTYRSLIIEIKYFFGTSLPY